MNDWVQKLERQLNKGLREIKIGDVVSGTIVKFSKDFAFVDIGLKEELLLPIEELRKSDGSLILKEGDRIEAIVIEKFLQDTPYVLSFKKLREKSLWDELKRAYKEKRPVEVEITGINKGGYEVEFGFFIKGFMPFSQSFYKDKPEILESFIGKKVTVKILEIKKESFLASRKEVLEEEFQEKKKVLIEKIKKGEPLEGVVKKKVEGGYLVEIDETIKGYLPYKELDWKRIDDPSHYLKIGEKVKVKALSYDPVKERLKLSIKALLPDPWEKISQKYREGDVVKGKITKIFDFGAFVEIEPGVEGLIPAREMSWNKKIKVDEILKEGIFVSALILQINPSERKMLLSLRKLEPDPWEELIEGYKIGDVVEGTIIQILPKGLLVELTPEISAFMPLKELKEDLKSLKKGIPNIEEFKIGDRIKGKIVDINPEKKRIYISYLKYLEDLSNKEIEEYKTRSKNTSLLTFGDLLLKKLNKNED